ncbi:MAG: hypothetical protein RIG84_04470 [Roseovarius sp.]
MSQIEELQDRLASALDRIGKGLEGRQAGGADAGEVAQLRQALDDERLACEQLKERVRAQRARREALEIQVEEARKEAAEAVAKLDGDLQSLRAANEQLRENNAKLREACEAGVAEAHLINKSMMAELEGLRATRAADRAEIEALLSELGRAVETAAARGQADSNPEAE